LVYVYKQKTASFQTCTLDFHGDLYEHTASYLRVFHRLFLRSGYLFPHVSKNKPGDIGRQLCETEFNKDINKLWKFFVEQSTDNRLPKTINSRYVKHSAVSAVHNTGSEQAVADVARAMSHSVLTAKRFYDETHGATVISRAVYILLEYCSPVWSPHTHCLIDKIDKVQPK
jgi:hypothetical protein